jgi:hypothetical protein
MTTQLALPQNGLKVGNQIVAEGDNVSLGTNVGVKGDLKVGGSILANRITTSFVTKTHGTTDALVIDCNYPQHDVTLSSNFSTVLFTNVPDQSAGAFTVTVYLQQDVLGNRAITGWPSNLTWPNSGPLGNTLGLVTAYGTLDPRYPVLQSLPFKLDVFQFTTFDGGLNWYGTQINPPQVQNSDLTPLQYALNNNAQAGQSGTVVQTKTAVNSSIITFGGSSSTPVDVVTMSFTPKYKTSRLVLTGNFTTGSSGSYPADFSVRAHFTLGTSPIQTGLNLSGAGGNLFYYDVYPNQNDRQQAAHFGGYFYAMNSNMHLNRSSQIYYDHGANPGTSLDLRIRAVHADAWGGRSCVVGTSWTGTSNGQGSYTVQVPSTLTVMEILQ